jgi:hypothetical protein
MSTKNKKCKDCDPCKDETLKSVAHTLPDCNAEEQQNPPCPFVLTANCIVYSVVDEETGEVTNINFEEILADITYTNTTPMPEQVGGYPTGTTFNAQTIQQMFDGLLYPYQFPAFTAFSRGGLQTVYEVGDSTSIGPLNFSWATSNNANIAPNTVQIVQLFAPQTTLYGPAANTGLQAVNITVATSSNSPATIALYQISATNTQGNGFSSTISAAWRFRIFHGTSAATSLNEAGIEGLASSSLSAGFAGTRAFAAGDYKYICYPASFGTATSFTDQSTGLSIPMEAPATVSVTNLFGVTANYRVHRTTNILGGSINIIVA